MADREINQFASDLLQSLLEARRGEGFVTSAEMVQARRDMARLARAKVAAELALDPSLHRVKPATE